MNAAAAGPTETRASRSWLLPADLRRRSRRDRVLGLLALVLAVFLVARAMRKDEGVLARNREFGARFLAHEDPYFDPARGHRVHGPYPPSYVLVTAPLALVPESAARCAWGLLQVASLAAAFVLVRRWLRRGWPELAPHAPVVFALGLVLASRYLLRDMAGGGGNLVYATCALWGIELVLSGAPLRGGAWLALSLVLKPNLAPFVVFLAVTRQWKSLLACLGAGAALSWLPALVVGLERWSALVSRWLHDVQRFALARALDDPRVIPDGFPLADTTMNQSLRETLWRFLAPDTAAVLARGLGLVLVLVAAGTAWRARGERQVRIAAAAFLPVALLVSPISWKAHHAALLVLFCVLVAEALRAGRRWLRIVLIVYYGACVLAAEELVGKAWKETLQEHAVVTLGAVGLLVAAVVLARTAAPAQRVEEP